MAIRAPDGANKLVHNTRFAVFSHFLLLLEIALFLNKKYLFLSTKQFIGQENVFWCCKTTQVLIVRLHFMKSFP